MTPSLVVPQNNTPQQYFTISIKSRFGSKTIRGFTAAPSQADLLFMKELIEGGHVTPVIDRSYPLNEVPDAMRCMEKGHARGKVVITLHDSNNI